MDGDSSPRSKPRSPFEDNRLDRLPRRPPASPSSDRKMPQRNLIFREVVVGGRGIVASEIDPIDGQCEAPSSTSMSPGSLLRRLALNNKAKIAGLAWQELEAFWCQ
ncbi:hypothetical protein FBZ93_1383 [Bradyrhizobium macuxiense]|uniref:Uncharacterized protein n=1 Tax=Bradyrhizobium macuxiense TaxID=1755647 RepID=A0A560KQ38_9BRAD|nr:hypothetical protein FBZ93_1383 [Bradyrhizobium macuxiense]